MGAEEIALALDEVRGKLGRADAVVVGERRSKSRDRNAGERAEAHDAPPGLHRLADLAGEIRVGQKQRELRVALIGLGDAVEEDGANDAAAPPDARHRPQVHVPAVLLGSLADELESLGIGDHLRGVERPSDVLDEGRGIGDGNVLGPRGKPPARLPLRHRAGKGARERRLGDAGGGNPDLGRILNRPRAGSLLGGAVQDDVDEGLARLRIDVLEHVGGDLDEVGIQFAPVPLLEHLADLGRGHAERLAHEVVGFGDELHVGVLDAVVDHLHEVAGAVGADVCAAGNAVDVGGDLLEHRAEPAVRLRRAAGHDGRPVEGALLAAGDAGSHEVQPALANGGLAAHGVVPIGVAAVDDDVAGVHEGRQLVDDGVGGGPGLDHDDRDARGRQRVHEIGHGLRGEELALVPVLLDDLLRFGRAAIVDGHLEAVAGQVARQVRTHHPHAGDADVRHRLSRGWNRHVCSFVCHGRRRRSLRFPVESSDRA